MNATSQSQPAVTSEVPLTRAAKEKLLQQMYRLAHWIELIRLFGYQTLPMDQARIAIKPLAEKFGKEPVAAACEELVEISTPGKEPVARLKPHIRRMAFQILGPEPTAEAAPATEGRKQTLPQGETDTPDSSANPQPAVKKSQRPESKTARKRSKPPTPAPTAASAKGHVSLMDQYRAAKERHPNMLLLFRMGDFYELFGEDAETAHKLLGLTLTTRDRTLPMAGFPHHQLEAYLHKLLHSGQRVAICEPVDDSLARGPIRREVTRVVTPGDMTEQVKPNESVAECPVRQPRHFVLKQCAARFKDTGLSFVAIDDVRRTTPAVAPYVGVLDFIVLRDEDKLLVTVRPHLQAKHLTGIRGLKSLYGPEYTPVRNWPSEGSDRWIWREYPNDLSACEPVAGGKRKPRPKRARADKSE
jgi:hypothetical protein